MSVRAATAGVERDAVRVSPPFVLVTVAVGAILAPINSTMLAVALPGIRSDFHVGHAAVGWLASSYLIAMAIVQPVGGRLGDALGRTRVYRAGLAAFLVFSLAAAVAPGFWLLLVLRSAQAVAGAILIPNGTAMLRASAPPARFGTYNGWFGAVIGSSAAVGPLLGGAVLAAGSWRWLFVANVPIVLAALLLSLRPLEVRRPAISARRAADLAGIALFAAVLVLATLELNEAAAGRLRSAALLAPVLLAVLAVFVRNQRRSPAPTADWRLLRMPSFAGASTHILLMNLAMYTTLLATPFFLKEVQGRSASQVGLLLSSMAALQAVAAPIGGRASDALGRRVPVVASSILAVASGVVLLVGLNRDVSLLFLAVPIATLGLAVGVGFVAASAAAIEAVPVEVSGAAAGTQSMMRYLGSIAGTGLLAGLLSSDAGTPRLAVFRELFALVTVLLALSIVAARLVAPRPPRPGETR